MAKKYRKRKIAGISLMLLTAAVLYITHHVLPYAIISRHKQPLTTLPSEIGLQAEEASFTINDSLHLKGYWITPEKTSPKSIMLLLHGIGGGKEHFYNLAKSLAEQHIASVVYDARGHGESDGQYISYGFYEKYDVSVIVNEVKQRYPNIPIGIWGNSMGGAVALQALSIEPRLDFGVIESTFTDLNTIVYDYQKRYSFGLGLKPICEHALKRAGEIGKFDPMQVRPIDAVKKIDQSIFLAHGTDDPNINFNYGQALFENLKSTDKTFYPVEGANHYNLFDIGGKPYINAIMKFIERQ
ncbi:alpha/beta fold hydrolase [uncultured Dokdonia sp.]|uniref:alpha/beta hydrolase n=1 Tax=uncultured Dokdonia sp. TaxID=575653 RepID=UPI002639CEDA|nr:alpha/beta fold hydrolase [uncultured Dokdonia sp.]